MKPEVEPTLRTRHNNGSHWPILCVVLDPQATQTLEYIPIIMFGRSKISLLIEKQNAHGTGEPDGLRSTQCEITDCVVFSNACAANFS